MKRRAFLKIAGGGAVLAAAGGTALALGSTPRDAIAPWAAAGGRQYQDPRMRALSYAILAPNPHNRQPWIVALEGDDTVVLRFDTDKQLPETDPRDRQLTIGLGCFLELLGMAAAADGMAVDLTLFPDGEDPAGLDQRPIARAVFRPDASVPLDPLWAHVMDRRSLKEPYDTTRAVPEDALARIVSVARNGTTLGGTVAAEEVAHWRALTEEALRIELETPHTFKESVDLFRIGKAEVNANPDGIDFSGPLFQAMAMTGLFSRAAAMDPDSTAFQAGIDAVLTNARTAMGHVWMVTPGNSRSDQIRAGADWLRVNLACTAEGLGFQPLSQALQEYPEMSALYDAVHDRLAPDGGTVQMLARVGYGPQVPASPRWPIEAKVRQA